MTGYRETAAVGKAAYELFFTAPDGLGGLTLPDADFLRLAGGALGALPAAGAGTHDYLHAIRRLGAAEKCAPRLLGELFEVFIRYGVLPPELKGGNWSDTAKFLLERAAAMLETLSRMPAEDETLDPARLLPGADALFAGFSGISGDLPRLAGLIADSDKFSASRVFTYADGKFIPTETAPVKPIDKFFGFSGVRKIFLDHFRDFAAGRGNVPLLIHSLPGYGKTSMTISHALAAPENVLILPEPAALEAGLEALIAELELRPDRRFVLFFDDVDSREINWYYFRTRVGGAFTLPDNVMIAISSNYEFPAGILSRGRKVSYPVFDEVRCTEMVEDFLIDFGLRSAPRNLVSLIGADYTEEFGQKKFTELSPRTLMRYLAVYSYDRNKRRTMVELASGPLVTRPDAELFYEFNINLMRSLYGEEYIQSLLKERLRSL